MLSRQVLVFLIVGCTSVVIDVGIMQTLIRAGVHYGLAASLGFSISLIFNFFCQAKITFRASSSFDTIFRFGCVVVMNYAMTMAFVVCSQRFFGEALFGKALSLPVIAVNSFLWSRYWVFRRP